MAKPNWTKIKAEYLKGGISYRKLAEKHGISESTLTKRAIRESWADDLQQVGSKVAAELPVVVAAVKLDAAGQWVAETLNIASDLRKRLKADLDPKATKQHWMGTMKGPELVSLPKLNDTKDVKTLIEALGKVDEIGRRQLGLDEDKGETELDTDWDGALNEIEQRKPDPAGG